MIPRAYITEWSSAVPWQSNEQVEQDLVICRALTAIFNDPFLAANVAFRGGTALHKLYIQPQKRYSEDIDLVQIYPGPIKETIIRLQECLSFLGNATISQRSANNTLKFRFDSEFSPDKTLRLKIEINCREHFSVFGYQKFPFCINSQWHQAQCSITTYRLEELMATKLRALYQRKKGRDLFDLYQVLTINLELNIEDLLHAYAKYMAFSVAQPPTQKQFLLNMDEKMKDMEFLGDIVGLLRAEERYAHDMAYALVKEVILSRI